MRQLKQKKTEIRKMKLIKNYNIIVTSIILLIAIYLWTIFVKIDYDPNYIMKGHHDYRFLGYLKFMIYCIAWVIFIIGIFQLKYHLMGKNRLLLISIIYFGIIGYILYLLSVCYGFGMAIAKTGAFRKALTLILPSLIILIFSWTKYVKKIHKESKSNKFKSKLII
jgi:hypothetical protein